MPSIDELGYISSRDSPQVCSTVHGFLHGAESEIWILHLTSSNFRRKVLKYSDHNLPYLSCMSPSKRCLRELGNKFRLSTSAYFKHCLEYIALEFTSCFSSSKKGTETFRSFSPALNDVYNSQARIPNAHTSLPCV